MNPVGIQKTWQNGSVEVSTGAGNPINITNGALNYSATHTSFLIEHEFILFPTYLDGEIDNVVNGNPPELWATDKCLKYVFSIYMANTLSDPNSFHYGQDELLLGNTGWIDETYNGNAANFTINSISYADSSGNPANGILRSGSTDVTVVVDTDLTINTSTKFALTHFLLPDEDQYKGASVQSSTLEENFLFENFVTQFGATDPDGDILKNVVGTVVSASQGSITFTVQYDSVDELDKIRAGNHCFLGLLIQDASTANTQMMLKLGADEMVASAFGDDETGLISFADFNLYQHPEDDGDPADGSTSVQAYVEDKLLSSFTFEIDNGGPVVDKVTARLVAYNSTDDVFFDIQKEEYDFTIYPKVGGIQQINLDTTRAFKLASGSDFNKVDCSITSSGAKDTTYTFNWAFAFDWADYKALASANSAFYDSAELNNGLNQNSSHYSMNVSNWGVYLFFDFDMNNDGNITTYRQISPELDVVNYDDYIGSNPWTVVKQLTNQAGTSTNNNILDTENTKISFAFTSSLGDVGSDYQAVIRLEEYQNGGLKNIWEISSYKDRLVAGNPLKPLTGETFAKITKSPVDTLTVEAEIDKDLINLGRQYQVSSRIWVGLSQTYVFEDGVNYEFEDSVDYDFE